MPASPANPSEPLPPLFGKERHLLGWQGFTASLPANWNPAKFSGNRETGELRIDDEEGTRLELRWETSAKEVNIQKSVDGFLNRLGKDAKKRKASFEILPSVVLVGKKNARGRNSITNFGWKSDPDQPAGSGYGVAWHCPHCNRVTFAQIIGRGPEKPERVERLAAEVLSSLFCHGKGGWETWSTFDLQLDVPEEFRLGKAQLLLNRLEIEWIRLPAPGLMNLGKPPERIAARRYPVANVLLANISLKDWAQNKIGSEHKTLKLTKPQATTLNGHEGYVFVTVPKDPRVQIRKTLAHKLLGRKPLESRLFVWNCTESNKIYVVESELGESNAHVGPDVLESVSCH